MSLGYFYLIISTRIYENRVSHLPCLSLFTVLFAYVASFISCFVVRDLCSISRRFCVLSNPPLPPSLTPKLEGVFPSLSGTFCPEQKWQLFEIRNLKLVSAPFRSLNVVIGHLEKIFPGSTM